MFLQMYMVTVIGSFWSIRYKDRLLEVKIHSTIEDDNSQLIYAADFGHYFVKSNWTQDSWAKTFLCSSRVWRDFSASLAPRCLWPLNSYWKFGVAGPQFLSSQERAQPLKLFFTDQSRVSTSAGAENSVIQIIGKLFVESCLGFQTASFPPPIWSRMLRHM